MSWPPSPPVLRGRSEPESKIISRNAAAACHQCIEVPAGCPIQSASHGILKPRSFVNASKRRGLRPVAFLRSCHAESHRLLQRASLRHSKNPRYRYQADAGDEISCRIVADCVITAKVTAQRSWTPVANTSQSRLAAYSPSCDSTKVQIQRDHVCFSIRENADPGLEPASPSPPAPLPGVPGRGEPEHRVMRRLLSLCAWRVCRVRRTSGRGFFQKPGELRETRKGSHLAQTAPPPAWNPPGHHSRSATWFRLRVEKS